MSTYFEYIDYIIIDTVCETGIKKDHLKYPKLQVKTILY